MFAPTSKVRVQKRDGNTIYGQPRLGAWTTENCVVLRLRRRTEKSSVRADSSASRGNAEETQVDAILLAPPKTAMKVNDIIEIRGMKLRVTGMEDRFDLLGKLDHVQITATYWSQA